MNNIQDINKEIENLKNRINELNKEKERLMIQESNISDIVSNGYIKIEDGNMTVIMKVYNVNFAKQNTYSINGFSLSINDHSLLIDKNAIYMKQFDHEELRKIRKITKDEFVKITNEMLGKSIGDLDEFVFIKK